MKQVIVIRIDLGMSVGKLAAQACHASVTAAFAARHANIKLWLAEGQTKILLQAGSADVLLNLLDKCISLDLDHALISDAGRTELAEGTLTALAVGPDHDKVIDQVTGALPLLR